MKVIIRRAVGNLYANIKEDKAIYLLITSAAILTQSLFSYYNIQTELSFSIYHIVFGEVGKATALALFAYYLLFILAKRLPSPLGYLYFLIKSILQKPDLIVIFLIQLFFINVLLSCYTSLKATIGVTFPFQYDLLFYELDRVIHFGKSPWEITHQLFSSPYASAIINLIYNLWFFIVWFALFYFMCQKSDIRRRFLIGFSLCWLVIGGVFAILLTSAGPCFLANIHPGNELFSALFQRLNEQNELLQQNNWISLWAISTQEMLWKAHISNNLVLGSGISAMPSMHVTMSVFIALSLSQVHKLLALIAWIFAICILIGSVHLGWHYAIDGYFSIIATTIIWLIVNRLPEKRANQQT